VNARFERAIRRFDAENSKDPNLEEGVPREWLYARRLSDWVARLEPEGSEALRLAARCQHIRRWEIPRSAFPMDRQGYHRWKNRLKEYHAELAGAILRECGYDEGMIGRVQALNRKAGFPLDRESQTMEDALCLVFLEFQFRDLAARTDREKIINALRKSWAKMSPKAREFAARMRFGPGERELLNAALAGEKSGTELPDGS
jgi:hypothetical protein